MTRQDHTTHNRLPLVPPTTSLPTVAARDRSIPHVRHRQRTEAVRSIACAIRVAATFYQDRKSRDKRQPGLEVQAGFPSDRKPQTQSIGQTVGNQSYTQESASQSKATGNATND